MPRRPPLRRRAQPSPAEGCVETARTGRPCARSAREPSRFRLPLAVQVRLKIEHKPNRRFKHNLLFDYNTDFGSAYNLYHSVYLGYDFKWRFTQKAYLKGDLSHLIGSGTGSFGMNRDITTGMIGLVFELNSKIIMSFEYRHRRSSAHFLSEDLGFTQNRFESRLIYDF